MSEHTTSLDEQFVGMSLEQRIAVRSQLMRAGLLDVPKQQSPETPLRAILNHLKDEEIAHEFMDWWKENHERMEASDDFSHPIDYAAEAWDAAIRSATQPAGIASLKAEVIALRGQLAAMELLKGNKNGEYPWKAEVELSALREQLARVSE